MWFVILRRSRGRRGIASLYEAFFSRIGQRDSCLLSLDLFAIIPQSMLFIGFVGISSGFSWQYAILLLCEFVSGAVAYFSPTV